MALILKYDTTEFNGMNSGGNKTATRTMIFSYDDGDSSMDLAMSPLVPQAGDIHPDYNRFRVESYDAPIRSDAPQKEFMIHVRYGYDTSISGSVSADAKPWELGPQNYQESTYEIQVPVKKLWQPKDLTIGYRSDGTPVKGSGKWIDCRNTAGSPLVLMDTKTVFRMSFTLNYKHKAGDTTKMHNDYSFNENEEQICNFKIPRYSAKMLPFSTSMHTVYASNGKDVKYEYDSVNVTIEVMMDYSWIQYLLNVGTLALFPDPKDENRKIPGAVYKYKNITKFNKKTIDEDYVKAETKFGPVEDVIRARAKFLKSAGEDNESEARNWFPFEEFTEQLPLLMDGTLDEEAIKDPVNNPYTMLAGFTRKGRSWSVYNLPRER